MTTGTVADVTDLLARHGDAISAVTVNRVVHAIGYRYRRPRHDLTHRQDAEAVAAAQHTLRELQEKGAVAGAGFRLVSVDEGDRHTHPHLARVWQRRGAPMRGPAAGKDERRAVVGALDYASGEVIWRLATHQGGEAFAAAVEQVAQRWPDEDLVLVLDNVSSPRAPAVRTWRAAQAGRVLP